MKVIVNGRPAGTKENGCALCGGTWGNYYESVEGEELFFCCNICAKAFINIVNEAKRRFNLNKIDYIELRGNFYRGRTIEVKDGERSHKFYIKLSDEGDITEFKELN